MPDNASSQQDIDILVASQADADTSSQADADTSSQADADTSSQADDTADADTSSQADDTADADTSENVMVSAQKLTKMYGRGETQVVALNEVDVAFEQGKFTAIMGPSGSGKSTLMHCLAGLDVATHGSIFIGKTDITLLNDTQLTKLRRDRVGFIFQAFNLVPTLTAEQNIKLPPQLAKTTIDQEWFRTIVERLDLTNRLSHKPHELSGGQQQRVAVARALLTRPDVIFADEPTGNLDSRTGAEVLSIMQHSTKEMGQTIIMVTHDPVAASYSDRVVLLKDGAIVDEIHNPIAETVLALMNSLGE